MSETSVIQRPWLLTGAAGRGPPGVTLDLKFAPPTLDPRITFTRASTATYFDSSGTMQTAAMNLWLQSADASNAAWGKSGNAGIPTVTANQITAPDGSLTAARIVYPAVSGAGQYSNISQQPSLATNVYTHSVYLCGNAGGEQLYLMATSDAVTYYRSLVTLTTAWQRFTLTTPSITGGYYWQIGTDLRDAGQTSKPAQTIYVWGGQLQVGAVATPYVPTTTVANGAPRFDYDPVTHALRGLLIEEARTNSTLQSADITNIGAWTKTGVVVTRPGTGAPDGTSLNLVTEDTGTTAHAFYGGGITFTAATWTVSVYVRAGTQRYISLRGEILSATNWPWITFDTQTQTINANANVLSSGFAAIGGGTFRIWLSWAGSVTAGSVVVAGCNTAVAPVANSAIGTSYTGTSQTWYAWGVQVELGALPTSYIPTTAAAVTRAVETCNMTPLDTWFNASAGSFVYEFDALFPSAVPGGFSSGAFANVIYLGMAGNGPTANIASAGTSATSNAVSATGIVQKMGASYSTGRLAACNNGLTVGTAVLAAGPYPWTSNMSFGSAPWSLPNNQIDGHLRRVRYWPRVLSSAELQQVTR